MDASQRAPLQPLPWPLILSPWHLTVNQVLNLSILPQFTFLHSSRQLNFRSSLTTNCVTCWL